MAENQPEFDPQFEGTLAGVAFDKPLQGIRVLDFSWVIAGPLCTQMLAQLGAEVIRVETSRRPEYRARSSYYLALGHSKQSLRVNLANDRGKRLVRALVPLCDVVVENFSSGVMERLGLGYGDLRGLRPDIIMASSSGLGRDGPRSDYLAYGSLLQIYTGWAGLIGFGSRPEVTIGGAWVDAITAVAQAFAIEAALYHRDATGEGQAIDLSMAEAALSLLPEPLLDYEFNGRIAEPAGNRDPEAAPHGYYPCEGKDRWIGISVRDDVAWKGLCRAMGEPDWTRDARFADQYGRHVHAVELDDRLAAWTEDFEESRLFQLLQSHRVAAAPVLSFGEVMKDAGAQERGFFTTVPQEDGHSLPAVALPWADEHGWRGSVRPVPMLGAQNHAVLHDLLGISIARIEQLEADGVLE